MRKKFSEILKLRPPGRGGARNERRSYSRIPHNSDSPPHESHELAGASAQPGPSGLSESRELDNAENLRLRAREQGEKRAKLLEQAQEALDSGNFSLWQKLRRLAEKCWKAMVKFNKIAAEIFFRGKSRGRA